MSRSFRVSTVALLVVFLATFIPAPVVSADPADRGARLGAEAQPFEEFTPAVAPAGADLDRTVRVMLRLADQPVALVKAAKPGKRIDQHERDSVKSSLLGKQEALRGPIEALGGRILGEYQSAYNGIKVEISRRNLSALSSLTGVQAVQPVEIVYQDNATSIPYIGAPQVWDGVDGFRGERVKVGIIDTGIDYTHANFGGPGTAAAYTAAHANETLPADPTLFGPAAPKVKGGTDLVGDQYDPNSADPLINTPRPDANPLDCNGHGSHVSGTVAGFGVTAAGATYTGSYTSSLPLSTFAIGPGVAPKADLYAIRVFGCTGATDVTVDAIDWAVDHDLDVINMSLGSTFGGPDDPSAVASDNAAKSGIVVVASAGNSGAAPYIVGSPSTSTRAISVAANDASPTFAGASLAFAGGTGTGATPVSAINANGATFADGLTLPVKVLWADAAHTRIGLGCNASDYTGTAGMLVVTARGTCARVARAVFGQQHGAAAVLMVNSSTDYPPFEGAITGNPDTGEVYAVTIPFLGVRSTDAAAVKARDGGTATITNAPLSNPSFTKVASFSSGGPRRRDSSVKPDVTAPGVATFSTAVGTGNQGERLSGTSMAAPHVTGVAALVVQSMGGAARDDDEDGNGISERVKAAITNTASSTAVAGWRMQRGGAGLVQPRGAIRTEVVATGDPGTGSISFGFNETLNKLTSTKRITLTGLDKEDGDRDLRFSVTSTAKSGPAHTVKLSSSTVNVERGSRTRLNVTLSVDPAGSMSADAFQDISGTIDFTPIGGANHGVALHVPYYMVFRGSSNLGATLTGPFSTVHPNVDVKLKNPSGALATNGDFYTWGISSPNQGHGEADLRAGGVQIFQGSGLMVFAINTWQRYSNAAINEYDIYVDVDRDGVDDYIVFGADHGLVTTGSRDGIFSTFVFNTRRNTVSRTGDATYLTDNGTVYLYAFRTQLRQTASTTWPNAAAWSLAPGNPRFSYAIDVFAGRDGTDDIGSGGRALQNAYDPSLPAGQYAGVPQNGNVTVPIGINVTEWANTPALGMMVVGIDNAAGPKEAILLGVTP